MESLTIKYSSFPNILLPQTPRAATLPGSPGQEPTPYPERFAQAAGYGFEAIYPYENECHVVGTGGTIHFEWDFAREPGGGLTGGEFRAFSPVTASKFYLFNTRTDLRPPPGHVLRTEPHPRFFTDDTGTVPLAMIGHLQNEWYPRMVFIVFRAPRQGQRHVFRKGEPFAQILFVPHRLRFDTAPTTGGAG